MPPAVLDPASFTATTASATQINLTFTTNISGNNVVIVWNNTGTFTTPAGTPPSSGSAFAGGTLLSNGTTSPVNHTSLMAATTYYYKAFSYNGSGAYSPGLTQNATTLCNVTVGSWLEDFELAAFPPQCWSLTGSSSWFRTTAASGYGIGTASAVANFYNISSPSPFNLITFGFDQSSLTTPALRFDYAYATYETEVDSMNIYYSTNSGSTWVILLQMPGGTSGILNTGGATLSSFIPNSSQWATRTISLPAGTNMVKFTAVSAFGNNLFLDNVKVFNLLANDVGTSSINLSSTLPTGTLVPKATVTNFGSATQTFNVQMTITGGYSSTKTVTGLVANASQEVTFDNWNATAGAKTVKVFTQLATDQNTSNDTLNKNVSVIAGWTNGSNFPDATYLGSGAGYSSSTEATNYIFSIGGNTSSGNGTECYKYDVNANTWSLQ